MAGTKKTEKQEDDQQVQSNTNKATVGAWWKSTVVEEKQESQPTEKSAVAPKPRSGRSRKKSSAAKPAVESKAPAVIEETAADSTAETVEVKPARKRPPRRKKKVVSTDESPVAATEARAEATEATEIVAVEKPARKRTPRKKAAAAVKEELPADSATAAPAAAAPATADTEIKPPRKRSPRKKKPAVQPEADAAEVVAKDEVKKPARKRAPRKKKEDAPAAQTADGVSAAEEVVKPARKRSPRKKKTTAPIEVPTANDAGPVEGDLPVQAVIAEALPEKEASAGSEETEITPTAQKRPGRRGRRPRKQPNKKAAAGEEAVSDQKDQTAAVDESEAQTVSGDSAVEAQEVVSDSGEKDGRSRKPGIAKQEKEEDLEAEQDEAQKGPKPVIKLLINAEEPEECRLALLEDGRLESIHVATSTRTQTKNNIYKAKVVAIEANLQAAFVEYGTDKNGFLPFSEIHPEYYKQDVSEKAQRLIDQQQWKKLSISDVMERGRELLVQVVKEEVGKKGANMTTYLSLPGRCVVLMPGSDSTGISRKISGEERRSLLRNYMTAIEIPEGIGWIVRTASIDITKTALSRDVTYLLRLWADIKKKGQDLNGVGMVYQDHDHVLRFLREHFDPDIQEILVDDDVALEQVKSFVELLPSKQRNVRVKLHRGARPIFNQYSIEDQIESIYQPRVNLPSGGSIVIDPTEALVAIDVNSGSTSKGHNFEESIFQANMEAAKELARQLRLRDLGGLIVVDFIDMRFKKNIREVEKQVKTAMKRDKAKVDISRISKFGLMQISRQKLGAPIEAGNYRVCTHCRGRGIVRSVETLALFYLRRIHTGATRKNVAQIECRFPLDVAQYLLNNKRQELRDLETKYETEVMIIAYPSYKPADNEIIFHRAEKEDLEKKRA